MIPDEPPEVSPERARELGLRWHPRCVVCGENPLLGLGLRISVGDDGSIECGFHCGAELEGYPGQVHGGVIAMLLDGAMTNCLFAHGHRAATAELSIRYHHPVATERPASVRAWIERSHPPLRLIVSALVQDGEVRASASAKFIDRRPPAAELAGSVEESASERPERR